MIRVSSKIDDYIQEGRIDIKLEQESRKVAEVFSTTSKKDYFNRNKNNVIPSNCFNHFSQSNGITKDSDFSEILIGEMQKLKSVEKKM